MPLQFPPTPASLLSRAYRPIVDESQEPRRAYEALHEPMPPAVQRLRRAIFATMAAILIPLVIATAWAWIVSHRDLNAAVPPAVPQHTQQPPIDRAAAVVGHGDRS